MKQFSINFTLVAFLFLLNTCARNPVTGKRQVVLMSEAQEIAMGQEADPQIVAQYGLYNDKALQAFITEKGKAMAAISHRPQLNYEFKVVDSEILNAFAVPGGYVYFTRGIMAHFNNEAEFAGVLGHEIGHITARHTVVQQSKQLFGQLGLIAGIIIKPELGQFAQQASQGLGLLFLKFGRDAERESDKLGVEYSSKINYDATQMAGFFNTLSRQSQAAGAEELPDFLSTHPNPGDRNTAVAQLAKEWKQTLNLTNPQVNRDSYLRRIEGLIYGEDPRQGFLENNVFYHPELKFQFNVPQSWKYQNSPQRVQMAPQDGQALMFLTLAPGKSLQEAGQSLLQQNNLQLIESRELMVNGLSALSILADVKADPQQQQQQPPVRTLAYLINDGGVIYVIMGASDVSTFNTYSAYFTNTMQSFKKLTDVAKINKKPERIRLKTVVANSTLEQALRSFKMTDKRMDELAILNGMLRNAPVTKGMLIKVVDL
ncbi:MAG: M48 family metalloprotease [Gloeobacteraceae cyanobacterium ES-bin-316]|nr:M48 family metalloprotease [Ferruginibacter sp.]